MILIMAIIDTFGVASIMPFLALLGRPELVKTNAWFAFFYKHIGFSEPNKFLFFLGLCFFFVMIISLSFRAITQLSLLRFSHLIGYSLSCRLLSGYLRMPYTFFLNRHSADLGKGILSEVSQVTNGVLLPTIQMVAQIAVVLFILLLLIVINPFLSLIVSFILGGSYAVIFFIIRKYLSKIGKDRLSANSERYKIAQEALGGIKEVKVFGREQCFLERYDDPAYRFAKHQANSQIAALMPRFALEMIAFGGILIITLFLFQKEGDVAGALPVLGLYALAGYKLLPALQQVYQHATKLRFNLPALEYLKKDLDSIAEVKIISNAYTDNTNLFNPRNKIKLRDITFKYPFSKTSVLKHINISISANSKVGIIGSTGSGKTTIVDLLLGLLKPCSGELIVDNIVLTGDNIRSWQLSLGYVPQRIYLTDDTIAANIAFGVLPSEIDMKAVKKAAKIAKIDQFIGKELPEKYQTVVGERGVRLSGGQCQRIAIARALYHDPSVLVFDEATSSLDNITEKSLMEDISIIGKNKTIIMVAHRITTVRDCDCIYIIESGKVLDCGNYDELLNRNTNFKKMVDGYEV